MDQQPQAAADAPQAAVAAPPQNVFQAGVKFQPLVETSPRAWTEWRNSFEITAGLSAFNDNQQKAIARQLIRGKAAQLIEDLQPQQHETIDAYLGRCQARFITPAAGQAARAEFMNAVQRADESLEAYHGRLRSVYMRAYPQNNPEQSPDLRERYARGLLDMNIAIKVMDNMPETYAETLGHAQRLTQTALLYRVPAKRNALNHIEAEPINAIDAMGSRGSTNNWGSFRGTGYFRGRGQFKYQGSGRGTYSRGQTKTRPPSRGSMTRRPYQPKRPRPANGETDACYYCLGNDHRVRFCPLKRRVMDRFGVTPFLNALEQEIEDEEKAEGGGHDAAMDFDQQETDDCWYDDEDEDPTRALAHLFGDAEEFPEQGN